MTKPSEEEFEVFCASVEPSLRRALTATYGTARGRQATFDALAWSWEHWDRLESKRNVVGYLYRVAQSQSRPRRARLLFEPPTVVEPWFEPKLPDALGSLTAKQRISVFLVYGAGWTHAEVASLLDIRVATVQKHVERGLEKLRGAIGGVDND